MYSVRRHRDGGRRFTVRFGRTATAVVVAVLVGLAASITAGPASADPPMVIGDAVWTPQVIPSTGGAKLYADVLRPKNLPANAKTPVVMSIGPYFQHITKRGTRGSFTDAIGRGIKPASRYDDLLAGTKLLKRGYTFVMVDLRGFGGSSGCPDADGPGEQSDVVSAVRWAATQKWSTGKVGLYGKSYDAVTGLIGAGARIPGLSAVVAQEPVYDWYRYLYGNGVPRVNRLGTPLSFVYMSAPATPFSPPPGLDPSTYVERTLGNFINPTCLSGGLLAQLNSRKSDQYWRVRNLLPRLRGSTVPLFLSQGFIDQNTSADGVEQALSGMAGPVRAWLGMWDHVRGNDTDLSALLTSSTPRRLSTGRPGYLEEVGRFYDRYLKGDTRVANDPRIVVQDNTGRWREAASWPQRSSVRTAKLRPGSYIYDGRQTATKVFYQGRYYSTQLDATSPGGSNFQVANTLDSASNAAWTVLPTEASTVRISGTMQVSLTTAAPPGTPVAIDVYDVDQTGTGTLISQNTNLVGNGTTTTSLFSTDWLVAAGHRIAVRITDSNNGRWLYENPSRKRVSVLGGSVKIPLGDPSAGTPTAGGSNSNLEGYLGTFRYPVPRK